MLHKGKTVVFLGSALIALYGLSAAFYGKQDDAYREISVFMEAMDKINRDYVEVPDMTKVQEGAMRGLIEALDPYSCFFTKEQFAALERRKASASAGPGMTISKRAEVMYVVSTVPEGAADKAGIRSGDYLIEIDGKSAEYKSILEIESLLRGEPDSKVKVTLFRSSRSTKPLSYELVRKADSAIPVTYQILDNHIGLLAISSMESAIVEQTKVKLKTLISGGAQKLILDLRGCARGSAADGAEIANYFLRDGEIYYSKNRRGEKVLDVVARPEKFVTDLPMVVLIDGSSAGGAEIVAGALKDQKRASIVGERSFGVGSAQVQIQLKSGAVIVLSVAKFYTPSGKMIQEEDAARNTGIKPDVLAPDDDTRQELMVESYFDDKEDAAKYKQYQEKISKIQLDKAVEILMKEQPALKKAA